MHKILLLLILSIFLNCFSKNWERKIDINNTYAMAEEIAIDDNQNIYIVGFGKELSNQNIKPGWWLKKYNAHGHEFESWEKKIKCNGCSPNSIKIDKLFNVYIVGSGWNLIGDASRHDWLIKKYDLKSIEDTQNWNKQIDGHNGKSIIVKSSESGIKNEPCENDGDSSSDIANAIGIDSQNNIYVAGTGDNLVNNSSCQNITKSDWWIKKFSENGTEDTINWNKKIDGYKGNDAISSMAIDKNDNIYVVGWGIHPVHRMFWWIKKFKTDGTEDTKQWDKRIFWQTEKSSIQYAHAVAVDSNNNIYVVGSGHNLVSDTSEFDWWIKKFSPDGKEDTTHWNKKFDGTERDQGKSGDDDEALAIAIDSQNNVYVAGYGTNLISPTSSRDWWIKKFDQNGNEDKSWEKRIDGNGKRDVARSIAIDKHDNVYVGGFGTNIVSEESRADWWIMKFGK